MIQSEGKSTKDAVDLSIIIVNWNSKDYLRKCLDSIFAETHDIIFEIIVIDNASFDGCGEMLAKEFSNVTFIQSKQNLGFGGANNVAFANSKGRNVLFLNPDTEITTPAINLLYSWLNNLPEAGILGAKLLNSDRTVQMSSVRAFPTILNQLLDAEVLHRIFPRSTLWGTACLVEKNCKIAEVDSISGACMCLRREVFGKLQGFKNSYFMYSEDVDLSYRARQLGWKNYLVSEAEIIHHGGGSTATCGLSDFSSVRMVESRWRFFRNTTPFWYSCLYRVGILIASLLRLCISTLLFPLALVTGKRHAMLNTLKKWKARLLWASGLHGSA